MPLQRLSHYHSHTAGIINLPFMAFPFHHVQALKTGEIRLNLLWEISIENKKHSLLRIIQDQRFQIINVKSIYDVHKIDKGPKWCSCRWTNAQSLMRLMERADEKVIKTETIKKRELIINWFVIVRRLKSRVSLRANEHWNKPNKNISFKN